MKPKNILVASCGEASPYKYNFKLADLGTSHFKRIRQNQTNVLDRDTYGGRAYGMLLSKIPISETSND